MKWFVLALSLVFAAPVVAQPLPDVVCRDLKAERAKYPDETFLPKCRDAGDPRCPLGDILNTVAYAHRAEGWGLNAKTTGYFVISPAGRIASDILHFKPTNMLYDVFIDGSGKGEVSCEDHPIGPADNPSRPFVEPVAFAGAPEPQPEPQPQPQPDQRIVQLEGALTALAVNLRELREWVGQHAEWLAREQQRVDTLESSVQRIDGYLATRPIRSTCRAAVFGIPVSCRLED